MDRRLKLQQLLESIMAGAGKVYFQPPANISMTYPCIVYKRDYVDIDHASNHPYISKKRYSVTVIDRNPDSAIPDKVAAIPTATFSTHFSSDNLNHDIYRLYF